MNALAKTKRQPSLMLFGILFVAFYALALSLAPAIRSHLPGLSVQWRYFIPLAAWLLGAFSLNNAVKRYLPNRDPWIFPVVMVLCGWGLLTVWRLSPTLGQKQIIWFLLSCGLFYIGLRQKELITRLKRYKYVWLFLGLLLIGLTFFIGVNPSGAGPARWLHAFGVFFQPSEPLKLLMLVYLSAFFADQIKPNSTLISSILPTLIIITVTGVLLMNQRDLGTALLFLGFYILMIAVSTNSRKFLWIVPVLAIAIVVAGYFTLDIVKTRVDIWLNPWLNTSGSSYQIAQAQIAVASGGLFGSGPGLGSPNIVPVAASDFVYTAIAEETGLFGTAALLLFFAIIILRGINIALSSKTTYGRYLAFGISSLFALQSLWIISGNLGILPLTGVTLPFMSYGGSSMVISLLSILILLKISADTSAIALPATTRKPYHRIAIIILVVFVFVIGWNSYLSVFKRDTIVSKAENPRWSIDDRYSPLGKITDQSGQVIVRTVGVPGDYERELLVPNLSTTVGYTNALLGKTGLERSLYPYLRGTSSRSPKIINQHQVLYNQSPPGADVKLNIIVELQNLAAELLGKEKGAIVLIHAQTGEVYAMVSNPYFDASTIVDDWETWREDENAPLINRTTQGSYPLGTLTNALAISAYWEQQGDANLNVPIYDATSDFYCSKAMRQSGEFTGIQHGCEATTGDLLRINNPMSLVNQLEKFGVYSLPTFSLEQAQASKRPEDEDLDQLRMLIPETKVSPLQMALVAASITNDGTQISPRLVNAYQAEDGTWKSIPEPSREKPVLTERVASTVRKLFSKETQAYWYAMGHSLLEDDEVITWYIGGTNEAWSATPLAIAIAIEGNNAPLAYKIAENLLIPQSE